MMDRVDKFIAEYEELCRKYQLYIDITADNQPDVFDLNRGDNSLAFEAYLTEWRHQN